MKACKFLGSGMVVVAMLAGCGGGGSTPKSPPGGDAMVALKVPGMT